MPAPKVEPASGMSLDNLPARIRGLRAVHNLSQIDLGIILGVQRHTIARWERLGPGANAPMVALALTCLHDMLWEEPARG